MNRWDHELHGLSSLHSTSGSQKEAPGRTERIQGTQEAVTALDRETVRAAGNTTATVKPERLVALWLEEEARSHFYPSIRATVNLCVHKLEPQSSMTLNHLLPQCSSP